MKPIRFTQMAMVAIGLVALSATTGARAENSQFQEDWLIKLNTQELKNQFRYSGSMINGVAKISVAYAREADKANLKPYELLWYHSGKPIGLERQGAFGLTKGQTAALEITHKGQPGREEYKAAANAILRILLDAYHNGNAIVSIKLPYDSFDDIAQELQNLNCVESRNGADEASKAKMSLSLESEPSGKYNNLYYY